MLVEDFCTNTFDIYTHILNGIWWNINLNFNECFSPSKNISCSRKHLCKMRHLWHEKHIVWITSIKTKRDIYVTLCLSETKILLIGTSRGVCQNTHCESWYEMICNQPVFFLSLWWWEKQVCFMGSGWVKNGFCKLGDTFFLDYIQNYA